MKPASLRTRFMLIVVLGAVLPLAIVGWWLSGTAIRSGRALLRGQLNAALTSIASDAQQKWMSRAGELQLLANNTVVRAALAAPPARLASADSQYLKELFTTFRDAIPLVTYVDTRGRERFAFRDTAPDITPGFTRGPRSADSPSDSARGRSAGDRSPLMLPIDIPIHSETGRVLGALRARVRLSSVIPFDSGPRVVPGSVLGVFDAGGALVSSSDSANLATPFADPSWETVSRAVDSSPFRLVLAGPAAPFVQPFERAASLGLAVLLLVALVALLVSAILTGRVTKSIERMAIAAEAVAAGNLDGRVEVTGRDETARLAEAFNAMTESLRRTIAELSNQRALAAVGEFAASLSHEVRNSLTAIRIDLQHATRQLPTDSPATPLVRRTLETARRLDSTVTSALRVARGGQTTRTRVDLPSLLRRAMASAEPAFAASEAILEPLMLPSADVVVDGDAAALEQLFLNLLLNAAQAMGAGGRARVEVNTENHCVVVRIIDSGPGFEMSAVPRDGVLHSTKPGGTGLGLPIARRIAAAHNGALHIDSAPGKGTTVVVRLPEGGATET